MASPSATPRPGWSRRVLQAFTPPESTSGGYLPMQDLGLRLQLVILAVALALVWLTPGLRATERATVTGLFILEAGFAVVSARLGRVGGWVRVISLFADIAAPFAMAYVVPALLLPILCVTFVFVAFHSYVLGRAGGVSLAVWSLGLALLVSYEVSVADRLSGFELLTYGSLLVGMALMLDALGRERRHQTLQLNRLHGALSSVSAEPDLQHTLDSVSEVAKEAVGAMLVVILESAGGSLHARNTTDPSMADADPGDAARVALSEPDASPSGVALSTGRPVVVRDFRSDERFSHWAPVADQFGFKSMVAVPFGPPGGQAGTLNAYFDHPDGISASDVELLESYSRQSALLVARAVAFERERDADQLKSQFVATVSHELRTPLTAVHGFLSTVLQRWEDLSDSDRREFLGRARRNAEELRRLVDHVLDFTTIEAGELGVAQERVALVERLRRLTDDLAPALGDHPVDLQCSTEVHVDVDPRGFDRILSNLLTNAAKFSPNGSPIEVRCVAHAASVWVEVQDHGPGIPHGEEDKIFERFYRTGTPGIVRGTGIGLAVARSFADLMGAALTVQRPAEGGACFRLELPLAPLGDGLSPQ